MGGWRGLTRTQLPVHLLLTGALVWNPQLCPALCFGPAAAGPGVASPQPHLPPCPQPPAPLAGVTALTLLVTPLLLQISNRVIPRAAKGWGGSPPGDLELSGGGPQVGQEAGLGLRLLRLAAPVPQKGLRKGRRLQNRGRGRSQTGGAAWESLALRA